MRLKNKVLFSVLFCACFLQTFAQKNTIKGKVISTETKEAIPFANIYFPGSTKGTTSGPDGNFSILIPDNFNYFIVSSIGFENDTVYEINNDYILVELKPKSLKLNEVVVTALGIKKEKKSLGYSVQEVKGEAFQKNPDASITNQLAGKIAGMQVTATNGGPGSSNRIILRGVNSYNDNQALVVIDGVPVNNQSNNQTGQWGGIDYGNGIADLNPDIIESITVLKGASASALYGSKASNGVILIKTKSGSAKSKLRIDLSSNTTFDYAYIHTQYQDVYGAGRNGKFEAPWQINANGIPVYNTNSPSAFGSWGPKMDGQTIIDWDGKEKPFLSQPNNYSDYFRTGLSLNNNISLSGGTDKNTYFIGFTNSNIKDIVEGTGLNKNQIAVNLSQKVNSHLKFELQTQLLQQNANNRLSLSNSYSAPRNIIMMPRHISDESIRNNISNELGEEQIWYTNWNWMSNPYWIQKYELNNDDRLRMLNSLKASFEISENFNGFVRANFDYTNHDFYNREAFGGISNSKGSASHRTQSITEQNYDMLLSYNKRINSDWSLNINGGSSFWYSEVHEYSIASKGGLSIPYFYEPDYSIEDPVSNDFYSQRAILSFYSFGQVNFKDFLYFDLTGRNDISSTLPAGNNSYFYSSANLAFLFTEAFKIKSDFLTFGKLRFSAAKVGKDTDPYQLEKYYNQLQSIGSIPYFEVSNIRPNYDLRPELTISYEAGSDMRFFNNKLGLDATYYYTDSKDQILSTSISGTSGSLMAIVNTGRIINSGIELQLNAKPFKSANGFNWEINFNWAKNYSEVAELSEEFSSNNLFTQWNLSIEARKGHPYGDIVGYGIEKDEKGNRLVDQNGMYVRTETPVVLGNYMPDFTGGVQNTISYKAFSIGFLIDFKKGGEIFSGTNMYGNGYSGNLLTSLEGREEWYASEAAREAAGLSSNQWTATGGMLGEGVYAQGTILNGEDVSGQTNQTYVNPEKYWDQFSKWTEEIHEPFVYDASFIKLRELSIACKLPESWFAKTPVKSLNLAVTGKNLWLIYSGVPNIDPEATYHNGNGQGFELYSYPTRRSIGFNLKMTF